MASHHPVPPSGLMKYHLKKAIKLSTHLLIKAVNNKTQATIMLLDCIYTFHIIILFFS